MTEQAAQPKSTWPHRWAVLLCAATFPLIWVGGLVTTYDAGMAVPDWPTTYGYNLFLYPWTTWLWGPWDLLIEHGHRLLGALSGLLTIALVVAVWWADRRAWLRRLALLGLALVLLQGALGGARVGLDERMLAMVHGCLGPAFLGLCVALAVCTSRYWTAARVGRVHPHAAAMQRVALLTACMAYAQLVMGAQLRHLSPMASPSTFRLLVLFHLLGAGVVVAHVISLSVACLRGPRVARLAFPAAVLCGLTILQLVLGPASWVVKYGWPGWLANHPLTAGYTIEAQGLWQAMVVTGHVATGSLVVATAVMLALRVFRLIRPESAVILSGATLVGAAT